MFLPDAPDVDLDELRTLVEREWGRAGIVLEPLHVGGDSWSFRAGQLFVNVRSATGQRHAWRPPRDVAAAFDAAIALHERAGLEFLLVPQGTRSGQSVAMLGPYAVVAMPYVDGTVHYRPYERAELAQVTGWLKRLHAASSNALPVESFHVDCADTLRAALRRAADDVGPFSVRLRELVRRHRDSVETNLAEHEALARQLRVRDHAMVVTHGEPFPGNVLHSSDGRRRLIDLSELMLAPAERDLAHLPNLAQPNDRDLPAQLYGTAWDPELVRFYHQRWGLEEIAICVDHLSRPHTGSPYDQGLWDELTTHYLST